MGWAFSTGDLMGILGFSRGINLVGTGFGSGSGTVSGGGGGAPAALVAQNGANNRGLLFGLEYPDAGADWALTAAVRRHDPTLPVAVLQSSTGSNNLQVRLPHSMVRPSIVDPNEAGAWAVEVVAGQPEQAASPAVQATASSRNNLNSASPNGRLVFTMPASYAVGAAGNSWRANIAQGATSVSAGTNEVIVRFASGLTLAEAKAAIDGTSWGGTVTIQGDSTDIWTHPPTGFKTTSFSGGVNAVAAIARTPLSASLSFDSKIINLRCIETDTIAQIAATIRAVMYDIRLSVSPINPYEALAAPYSQGQLNETGLITFSNGALTLASSYFAAVGTTTYETFATGVDIEGFEVGLDENNKEIAIRYHSTDNIGLVAQGYDEKKVGDDGNLRITIIHDTVETNSLENPPISSRPFLFYYADGVGSGGASGAASGAIDALAQRIQGLTFADIHGEIADDQIPDGIARDDELATLTDGEFTNNGATLDLVLSNGDSVEISVPDELREAAVPITFHQAHTAADLDTILGADTDTVRIIRVTNFFTGSNGIAYRPRDVISVDTNNDIRTIIRGVAPETPIQESEAKQYNLQVASNGSVTWVEAAEGGGGEVQNSGRASYAGDLVLRNYGYTALGNPTKGNVRVGNPVGSNFDRPVLIHLGDSDDGIIGSVGQLVGSTISLSEVGGSVVYSGTVTSTSVSGNIVTFNNTRSASSSIQTSSIFDITITSSVLSRLGGVFTGEVSGPTPTSDANLATKLYVDQSVAGAGGSLPVPQDTMYIELSDDTTPTPADATTPVSNGSGMLSAFTDKYMLIYREAAQSDIRSVIFNDDDTGTNQVGAFTKRDTMTTREGVMYNVWISMELLSQPNSVIITVR